MAELKSCALCGEGSHREEWKNSFTAAGKSYVACDGHSTEEIAGFKKKVEDEAAKAKKAADEAAKATQDAPKV